jgi:hypothetical protein
VFDETNTARADPYYAVVFLIVRHCVFFTTPSCVAFTDTERQIGDAKNQTAITPKTRYVTPSALSVVKFLIWDGTEFAIFVTKNTMSVPTIQNSAWYGICNLCHKPTQTIDMLLEMSTE